MRRLAVSIALFLGGCAAGQYQPPVAAVAPATSTQAAAPADAAWRDVVAYFETGPGARLYTIDSRDAANGTLGLSFTSNRPSDFIDCGAIKASWDVMTGGGYIGNYADYAATYHHAILLGKMTVTVQGEGDGSVVAGKARYVFQVPMAPLFKGGTWSFASGGSDTQSIDENMKGVPNSRTCRPSGLAEADARKAVQ